MPNATPWSHEEDIRLCSAYTNISEDGCISTDQDATHFWDQIHQLYTQLGEDSATTRKQGLCKADGPGLLDLTLTFMPPAWPWFKLKHTVAGQTQNIRTKLPITLQQSENS
ncbi:hypothetical protein F442_20007 [Phytophthora nicotianae P10297]|uniref:Uncharacterized protein n=3 Tax=Phytophthora nicotianae TaxID=4792 RepID=V9E1W5_PHYNI|nr:hypothetical protein F443_20187 [Phytophthora nicotianae P1569]ETM34720.1 hypothetical protein L914_18245 [Phytophthora nicotianae]ETP31067.1 hypothetical protein F442_20007 [Phytophthora nicotianae P10297]